jgi:hypothetical protein
MKSASCAGSRSAREEGQGVFTVWLAAGYYLHLEGWYYFVGPQGYYNVLRPARAEAIAEPNFLPEPDQGSAVKNQTVNAMDR